VPQNLLDSDTRGDLRVHNSQRDKALVMRFFSDRDVYDTCPPQWLWIYDKVIVARRQGIQAAPAGIPVPTAGEYIVRPITNIRMMGRGASRVWLEPNNPDLVPDGYFWSEVLEGPHVSVDYHWGQQHLTVQGFRDDPAKLDRFSRWCKIDLDRPLPGMLHDLKYHQEWINVEYIGDRAIEIHLRYNDDFANHDADEIQPVWRGDSMITPTGWSWYHSPAGDRLGFWIKNK